MSGRMVIPRAEARKTQDSIWPRIRCHEYLTESAADASNAFITFARHSGCPWISGISTLPIADLLSIDRICASVKPGLRAAMSVPKRAFCLEELTETDHMSETYCSAPCASSKIMTSESLMTGFMLNRFEYVVTAVASPVL